MIATKNHQGLFGQQFAGGITLINKNLWPRFGAELTLGH
jgi:hypothetical protein